MPCLYSLLLGDVETLLSGTSSKILILEEHRTSLVLIFGLTLKAKSKNGRGPATVPCKTPLLPATVTAVGLRIPCGKLISLINQSLLLKQLKICITESRKSP